VARCIKAEFTPVWKFQETTIGLEEIRASVQRSLDLLETIPNLLLIHNPYIPEKGKLGEFWGHLETLVADGTLKGCSLGVSNFRPVDIEAVMAVAKIKPVVNREFESSITRRRRAASQFTPSTYNILRFGSVRFGSVRFGSR
jgi:diketogulonate reductase-like aldo/keto reductase